MEILRTLSRPDSETLSAEPSLSDIERDLELKVVGPQAIPSGGLPALQVTLANRSRTGSHRIVLPNDGHEVGWTEPAFFCTAEALDESGRWGEAPRRPMLRCGNVNGNWPDSVRELRPGEAAPLTPWSHASTWYDFWEAKRVRLTFHYLYRTEWKDARPLRRTALTDGPMRGVPGFYLSAKVEFDVLPNPLELQVQVLRSIEPYRDLALSEVLEATLTNTSTKSVEVRGPGWRGSQIKLEDAHWYLIEGEAPRALRLEAGERVRLFAKATFEGILGRQTLSLSFSERRTRLVFHYAYADADGLLGSVRSNEFTMTAAPMQLPKDR